MRVFCGISLSYEVRRNVELLLQHLHGQASIAWSPIENLHITTKFVGEWPDDRLDELRAALEPLAPPAPAIHVAGLGWFPNPHQPRLFFAGVTPVPELLELAQQTDAALGRIGVPTESKPYQPHLTLARIKPGSGDLSGLRRAIAQLPSADFGRFLATRHLLYESRPGPTASRYAVVAEFPFSPVEAAP